MERPIPDVDGVEHRFVDAGGVRLHVAEAGAGDALLLLHGWPQHWFMWRDLIGPLAKTYRVLAPDLRGFGWSEAPGDGYDPGTFARDQVALLDALGIERARVIGHDWGGFTTLLLALGWPDRIERIVACSTPHPWTRPRIGLLPETWRSWYALVAALPGFGPPQIPGLARFILTHGHVRDPFSHEDLETFTGQFRESARARGSSALYRSYFRLFARAGRGAWRAERLTVPALLLHGEHDLYVTAKLVAERLPRQAGEMRVALASDAGHFVVDERPELVLERATEFLADS